MDNTCYTLKFQSLLSKSLVQALSFTSSKEESYLFAISLQKETLNKIGELTKERAELQNSVTTKTPSERVKVLINKLKAVPDDFDDVENIDFKSAIEYKIRKSIFTTQFGILIVNQ